MKDSKKSYKSAVNPFFMESVENGTDTSRLEYPGRGEEIYFDARQVLVRTCHDALVSHPNERGEKGILLIRRKAQPAQGYLWPLGGFVNRGVSLEDSFYSRIKEESGLEIDKESLTCLGFARMMWKNTPHKNPGAKKLPQGIDDAALLFYCEGNGKISLDKLHEMPTIVTPEMYQKSFREKLHPYVRMGMDRAIKLIG